MSRKLLIATVVLLAVALAAAVLYAYEVQQSSNKWARMYSELKADHDALKVNRDALETFHAKMAACAMEADAEAASFRMLNGTRVPGKPDVYTTPKYIRDEAARMKRDKLEECKLLYGQGR